MLLQCVKINFIVAWLMVVGGLFVASESRVDHSLPWEIFGTTVRHVPPTLSYTREEKMEIPSDQKWSAEILPTPDPSCDPVDGLYEEEGNLKVPLAGRARDWNGRALGTWQGLQVHRGDGKAGSRLQCLVEVVLFRGWLDFWFVWLRDCWACRAASQDAKVQSPVGSVQYPDGHCPQQTERGKTRCS